MSWHCLICGSSLDCNGLMDIYHIGGGIPKRVCIHLTCLANKIKTEAPEFADELWEKENDNIPETDTKRKE